MNTIYKTLLICAGLALAAAPATAEEPAGSEQQAKQLYDIGFKLGIAATVSFERARKLRAVVAAMPLDALLLESDAPDQPGAAHRGELNQPAYVVEHLETMAKLRDMPVETLALALTRNTEALFGLEVAA